MFITTKEKYGTCYYEFQFCRKAKPVRKGKVKTLFIEHWLEDSLLLTNDDFENFFERYVDVFNCALFPNGDKGFYPFGINYYDKETTYEILCKLKEKIDEKYIELIPWLEDAFNKYNGFYILGL